MQKPAFLLLFILLGTGMNAQTGWTWRNPLPQGNPLHSISFLRDYGMAVGEKGTAIHTQDGGANWRIIDLGTEEDLNDVVMHDDLMAFIAGNNGLLLWVMYHADEDSFEVKKLTSNTLEDMNAVTSDINGCPWAAGDGGFVLRSSDFGQNWTRQNTLYTLNLNDLHNIECTEAWAIGPDGMVIYTYDLGVNWTYRPVVTTWDLYSIHVGTFENIRVCGQQGTIWRTTDKGLNWNQEHAENGYNLYGIVNAGLNCAYAAGDDGKILETNDYGENWVSRNTGITTTLYDITFHGFGYDEIWAAGHYGTLLKNAGVGSDFKLQNKGTMPWLYSVEFTDETTGWAVGRGMDEGGTSNGIILNTTDGGETWLEQSKLNTPLRAVDFINNTTGWAVGDNGVIFHTQNAGGSWSSQTSTLVSHINSVSFVNENDGWAVSMHANIIHTSNGGVKWTLQTNPDPNPLHDVFFVNENLGFAVGLDSTIMRTTNGGTNWNRLILGIKRGYRFASVFFIDENFGWVVGIEGSILLTENGGDTWMEIESGVYEILNDVYFTDHENGWIAGDRGTILRTVNGGRSWFKQNTGVTANFLCGVHFTDLQKGCAVGEGGTIITTSNGGFKFETGVFRQYEQNLPIQDMMTTLDTIDLSFEDNYRITDIEVFIDTILHPSVGDLEIYLEHEGIVDTLMYRVSNDGENIFWTLLSDHGSMYISEGIAPYSGEYRPHQNLSVFYGTNPSGKWILRIFDSAAGNTGTLVSWGIRPVYNILSSVELNQSAPYGMIELEQNYPNPVTGSTVIKWKSQLNGKVILSVYNIEGKLIATPVNKFLPAGEYSIDYDVSGLPPGFYYYIITAEKYFDVKKMIVINAL